MPPVSCRPAPDVLRRHLAQLEDVPREYWKRSAKDRSALLLTGLENTDVDARLHSYARQLPPP